MSAWCPLRRTYKTIAQNECKIPEEISFGQVPEGMSQRYLLRWAMSSGKAIVEAQHKIPKAIMAALRAPKAKQGET
jgi:hypothetical protein